MKVVFASRNAHKTEQVRLLVPQIDWVTVDDVVPGIVLEEPYETFEGNALSKARTVLEASGLPAAADDSGLEVDALGGAPGVRSARYAGPGADDETNNAKLLQELSGISEDRWTCRYRCVAVFVDPGGREIVTHGVCEGRVVSQGRGRLGFGYDPFVIPDGEVRTMGEIPLAEKLRFSHRGKAFRRLSEEIADGNV